MPTYSCGLYFEWGKRRNEKRAASFQIGAATDNLHQVSDHVNLEVQTARVSLSQAMEQVQLTRNFGLYIVGL